MYKHLSGALLSSFLLIGSSVVTAETLATVNGEEITEDMLLLFQQQLNRTSGGQESSREDALDQLINFVLVTQDAEKQGIDKRPDVQRNLAWQRRGLLVQLGMSEYMQKNPVTDAELQTLYDEFFESQGGEEYKARHILVETEAEANAIIEQLDDGGDFAKLAEEKSIGPTKTKGGDLGWFSPDRMVKPFSDAVAGMKKGTYTKTPVKTQFGWHVIKLEDQRALQPPPIDQVKPQLEQRLTQERLQEYFKQLRDDAKLDIK